MSAFSSEGDINEQLWKLLEHSPPFVGPCGKANLNRFFSTPGVARMHLKKWHESLLNHEFLALEEDRLGSRKLSKLVVRPEPGENDEQARASTDARRPTICDTQHCDRYAKTQS